MTDNIEQYTEEITDPRAEKGYREICSAFAAAESREQELERQIATLRADKADLQARLATAESHVQRLSQRLADVRKAAG